MTFFKVIVREPKNANAQTTIEAEFQVPPGPDLMVRGGAFYGVWDEELGRWSRDINAVQRIVDKALRKESKQHMNAKVKYLSGFNNGAWATFNTYLKNISSDVHILDSTLKFADQEIKKSDYATRKLPYSISKGSCKAWDALLETLYDEEERRKIEWAIGSIVSGKSKRIQKFFVLYGSSGTGKSTVLNIIEKLFEGYTTTFDAKSLGMSSRQFATSAFSEDPLVAIQHDGDLSRIEDNTRLNSIVSHEKMLMDEKFKKPYQSRVLATLFVGTNSPVKITDSKSGLLRRLIDISPTGNILPSARYHQLMSDVEFELGAIANKCLNLFNELGEHYYDDYRPDTMMYLSNKVYQFIMDEYDYLIKNDPIQIKTLYSKYIEYCNEGGVRESARLSRTEFKNEICNYYKEFKDRSYDENGARIRNVLEGFKDEKRSVVDAKDNQEQRYLQLRDGECEDRLQSVFGDCPAQLATSKGTPSKKWDEVKTTLKDVDTHKLHYVRLPNDSIVIDIDLKDSEGNKSLERALAKASEFPPTYAEVSKSGNGIHLHYIYDGDASRLSDIFEEGVEIKKFIGKSALRRKLTLCNDLDIATIDSGLPLKKEDKVMIDKAQLQSERALRDLIMRNLRKEIHPGTKPSIDFIAKILEDAYESDLSYDVTDLKKKVLAFAQRSTNHSFYCLGIAAKMKYASKDAVQSKPVGSGEDAPIVFYDVEVFPNLFVVCWMYDKDMEPVAMINPSVKDIEALMNFRLVGFNNRRYDNHILYGAMLGYDNQRLYELSQNIVNGVRNSMFPQAYGISYTDIYDFSSKKQSLKKFEIDLGIAHVENTLPWDEPVSDDDIQSVVRYCKMDVRATRKVFHARSADYKARLILSELSGLSANDTTNQHTARILFGKNPEAAKKEFVYTHLNTIFPGYKFDKGKSSYKGEDPSEGGYVYAEPGMYENVAVLDVASMHPTSIEQLNLFGPYTKNFSDLKKARVAIKHADLDTAGKLLDGALKPYLNPEDASGLAYALKIVINTVYGMTSAKFDNPFRDVRNIDNIVAKRGALFMIDLKNAVQAKGYTVAHIKTDSIKIPNADQEIIDFIFAFGKKYGYDFEHESTYDKMCLVNNAVYIAREGDKWEAVGAEFQHPVVYKTLFTKQPIEVDDYKEVRQVSKGHIIIQYDDDSFKFVGRFGEFIPTKKGGVLYRLNDDKEYAVTGTKGWLWEESGTVIKERLEIDTSYANFLVNSAKKTIEKFGSFEEFVKE